jgi:PAS domain S-box-containing protein
MQLTASEAALLAAFDSSPIGMLIVTLDRRVVRANAAAGKLGGYSQTELVGLSEAEGAYAEDIGIGAELYAELIAGKREQIQLEKRYLRKNGEVFWARVTASVVREPAGNPLHLLIMVEDIDEQKRILATLQESEARFRAMFEHSPVGIGLLGLDRTIIDANPAMCKMLGRSRQEMVGQTPAMVSVAEDYGEATRLHEQLVSGAINHYNVERRYIRGNGEIFWTQVYMSMVRDAEGKPLYMVGLVSDIDDKIRARATLQESERRFRAIFENSAIGITLTRADRRPVEVNPVICQLSGFTREEFLSQTAHELSYPEDKQIGDQEFQDLLAGRIDSYQLEKRFRRKQGGFYWARLTVSGVRGPDGRIQFVLAMTEDITERKKAQDQLQESEARFRAMYENAAVGMAMMSLERKVISLNQTAACMTGYGVEELVGSDATRLSHPEDTNIGTEQFRAMIAGRLPGFSMEKRYVRKSGESFWGRVTYSAVPGKGGQPEYLVGMIEDVTEQRLARERLASQEAEYRRTMEERVEERTSELAEANLKLREEFEQRRRAEEALANKAAEEAVTNERTRLARDLHDAVTQTMFAASLIAEVLPDLWEIDPAEARASTEELRQLTRGALAEMRTLLLELRPAALLQSRLGDLIRQLCEALIGRARLPIDLTVEGERQLPPEVQVAFYRIAQESLNNAAKYARATRIEVGLFVTPAGVHFNICDNGVGFDPASIKATSLGMRIMRERAEAIGAELSISSEPGKGVCVEAEWIEKPDMVLSVFKR